MPRVLIVASLLAVLFLSALGGALFAYLSGDRLPAPDPIEQAEVQYQSHPARGDNSTLQELPARTGVVRWESGQTAEGYTLYSTVAPGSEVRLVDMQGNAVHEWVPPEALLAGREALPAAESGRDLPVVQATMLAGGDLIMAIEADTTMRRPGGLARVDKDSNAEWLYAGLIGAALDVSGDDNIVGVELAKVDAPLDGLTRIQPPFFDERLVVLDSNGKLLQSISLFAALNNSSFSFLLQYAKAANHGGRLLGVNAVRFIDKANARAMPFASAGDILVSLGGLDVVAVVDLDEGVIKWAERGGWHRQTDVQLLAGGRFLIFDSFGDLRNGGESRVLEVQPVSLETVWSWPSHKGGRLFSSALGSVERLANGNNLVSEAHTGRLVEISQNGQIVWEYVSPDVVAAAGNRYIKRAAFAKRISTDQVDFLAAESEEQP